MNLRIFSSNGQYLQGKILFSFVFMSVQISLAYEKYLNSKKTISSHEKDVIHLQQFPDTWSLCIVLG